MRIATWNVNGMRAALRKGFAEHLVRIDPDVLLLQEVRALPEQLPELWVNPSGYHVHWNPADRKGYAGTAVWSKQPLEVLGTGLTEGVWDDEGRVTLVKTGGVIVASLYLPKGDADTPKQVRKEKWMADLAAWAGVLRRKRTPVVLGGDLNVAHTARDLYYAKPNEKTSGFLPQERAWMTGLLEAGWSDTTRAHFGERDGPYSWWSNRGQARQLDRGWRIDYLLANRAAARRVTEASIDRVAGLACSDHAPVIVDLSD